MRRRVLSDGIGGVIAKLVRPPFCSRLVSADRAQSLKKACIGQRHQREGYLVLSTVVRLTVLFSARAYDSLRRLQSST